MKRRGSKDSKAASTSPPQESVPSSMDRGVAKRWTTELTKDGWTAVSNFFLENYSRLSPPLTTPEAMLVIHLMSFKWNEKLPFPGFKTLATRMGISQTAVRGHARRLDVWKKYLKRIKRVSQTNQFDLSPLFQALVFAWK